MIRPLIVVAALLAAVTARAELLEFSDAELRRVLQHGPWPVAWHGDPSNRASGNRAAIALGERLFFDPRLSAGAALSCASCHMPRGNWTDARPRGMGREPLERNTPSLWNVRLQRWFGWDGGHDSLWSQSMRPILEPREMRASAALVAALLRHDRELACRYGKAFGAAPGTDDERLLVEAAKALAAFQETLVTGRTAFDEFRDAIARGDRAAAARYPAAAQRGLRIFVGAGNCSLCHFGPNFSNSEFGDVGIGFFVARGRVDPGRYAGVRRLKESRYNLLGPFNDDPRRGGATLTRHVAAQPRNFGEFRVPSLRNVALSAPYMHNGSLGTLRDVVRHYSELDEDRLHADGARILRPLHLSDAQAADLVAFLESLSDPRAGYRPAAPGHCAQKPQ